MSTDELANRTSLDPNPLEAMDEFFTTRGNSIYEMFEAMDVIQDDEDFKGDFKRIESIQPFIATYSEIFRQAKKDTVDGYRIVEETGGMGGIRISNTKLDESEELANFLISAGATDMKSLDFLADLNEISLAYDQFITAVLQDKRIAAASKIIPISPEAVRIKKELVGGNSGYTETQASTLNELVTQLDRNQRKFQVMDEGEVKLEDTTFSEKVNLTLKLQEYFLDLEKKYDFSDDKNTHRRNFSVFMAKFFDAMESDYNLSGSYDSFLRSQERGVLSSVQAMLFFQDRGYEIIQVDEEQDTKFKVDFIARKNGVDYSVQAKSVNRGKLNRTLDGTIVYVDDNHFSDVIAKDGELEPIFGERTPKDATPKLKEFTGIHNKQVSDTKGWIWIEVDPYMGIKETTLKRTGRLRQAA